MTKTEFMGEMEALMEMPAGALSAETILKDLAQWDSMQVLSFIVMVEEKLGTVLDGDEIAKAKTVGDLLALLGDQLQ
ncbi:MAG: acyl carrier protein [Anaerolineae bacterium]|nr:acyl carrier protein [Anaerolineae bacterium]